jgi:signal transduction histidine kinase
MFALKASEKGLTFSLEEDQSVPHYVCSDEAKVRQILINLISNAIKFTTQGSITTRMRTKTAETS